MITVKFFSLLRLLIKQNEIILDKKSLSIKEVLELSQEKISTPFLHKLLDENSTMIVGTIILVNGHNVHHLQQLETEVKDGDVVSLFPPGGGG